MDDITDLPFRELCKSFGADLLITEFIASEALNREAEKSYRKMRFTPAQRPLGIQIFGADEGELLQCLEIVEQQQPDFIDINWGCPVRKVAGKGAGSGILKDIPKMLHITEALVKHAHIPVTVKTRLGYDANDKPIVELAERLQDIGIAALSIHGRTKTQMYQGSADWTLIGQVKNNPRMHIPIFSNGDIVTPQQAIEARQRYGVDGILIGRGAIGNPWIFEQTQRLLRGEEERPISVAERVRVAASTSSPPSSSKASTPPCSRCASTTAATSKASATSSSFASPWSTPPPSPKCKNSSTASRSSIKNKRLVNTVYSLLSISRCMIS